MLSRHQRAAAALLLAIGVAASAVLALLALLPGSVTAATLSEQLADAASRTA